MHGFRPEIPIRFFGIAAELDDRPNQLDSWPDDQIVPYERLQRDEELLGFLGIEVSVQMYGSSVIDDADVHGVGVQIDSAVEFVL